MTTTNDNAEQDDVNQIWALLARRLNSGNQNVEARPNPRDIVNIPTYSDGSSRGYRQSPYQHSNTWVSFDELTDNPFVVSGDDLRLRQDMISDNNRDPRLSNNLYERAAVRLRGTGVNVYTLPKEAVEIISMPSRDAGRKEVMYLKIIQDLKDQVESIQAVNRCTIVEKVEL